MKIIIIIKGIKKITAKVTCWYVNTSIEYNKNLKWVRGYKYAINVF